MLDTELWGRVIVWSDKSGSMAYQRAPADGFTRTNRGSDMILQRATREVDVLRVPRAPPCVASSGLHVRFEYMRHFRVDTVA